jgi:hypothetical protein
MTEAFIKRNIQRRMFCDAEEPFAAIPNEWDNIDQNVFDNLLGSFKAQRQVCSTQPPFITRKLPVIGTLMRM